MQKIKNRLFLLCRVMRKSDRKIRQLWKETACTIWESVLLSSMELPADKAAVRFMSWDAFVVCREQPPVARFFGRCPHFI